jgi:hypothetical protein
VKISDNPLLIRVWQSVLDSLDHQWFPETFYTLAPLSLVPTYKISEDYLDALEPFLGKDITPWLEESMQAALDCVTRDYINKRHIIAWTTENCRPCVVERAMIVQSSQYSYRVAPYLDRTAIMNEAMEKSK